MKKLLLAMLALSLFTVSCSKKTDDPTPPEPTLTASFTMNYDGVTYTEFDPNSMMLVSNVMAIQGTTGDGFSLSIIGVAPDGSTVDICVDPSACQVLRHVTLDFGASVGMEGFVATSGTIKRTGNKIEVQAVGIGTTDFETKTLTATIEANKVIDF